jgi:hypothetical protein
MIPDLQSALLCDDVRQERNGKFMLIGLFDALASPELPINYPRLFVVTRWCSGEGEFEQETKILKPDQSTVLVAGKKIVTRLPSQESTATNVEVFLGVSFTEFGTHWVEITLGGDLKLRFPLRVSKVELKPNG